MRQSKMHATKLLLSLPINSKTIGTQYGRPHWPTAVSLQPQAHHNGKQQRPCSHRQITTNLDARTRRIARPRVVLHRPAQMSPPMADSPISATCEMIATVVMPLTAATRWRRPSAVCKQHPPARVSCGSGHNGAALGWAHEDANDRRRRRWQAPPSWRIPNCVPPRLRHRPLACRAHAPHNVTAMPPCRLPDPLPTAGAPMPLNWHPLPHAA